MTIPNLETTSKQRDLGLLFITCCFIQQGLVTPQKNPETPEIWFIKYVRFFRHFLRDTVDISIL